MNFFQRRRFLKSSNLLDLVPVRLVKYEATEENKVDLKVPKFRNEKFARWFIPSRKPIHITIHLDQQGSAVWLAMDGQRNVQEIVDLLQETLGADTEKRIAQFCTKLYDGRYITFRQILEHSHSK